MNLERKQIEAQDRVEELQKINAKNKAYEEKRLREKLIEDKQAKIERLKQQEKEQDQR